MTYMEALHKVMTYNEEQLHNYLDILQELSWISYKYVHLFSKHGMTGNDTREWFVIFAVELNAKDYSTKIIEGSLSFEEIVHAEFKMWFLDRINDWENGTI